MVRFELFDDAFLDDFVHAAGDGAHEHAGKQHVVDMVVPGPEDAHDAACQRVHVGVLINPRIPLGKLDQGGNHEDHLDHVEGKIKQDLVHGLHLIGGCFGWS